jgi:type II secretory pathway predicted ATPase ExeA
MTPDPEFFFQSKGHKKAMTYLNYSINDGEGFAVITGEIGAGKTTLVRTVLRQMKMKDSTSSLTVAYIKNTLVSPDQFIRLLTDEFGVARPEDGEKDQVLIALNDFLIKQFSQGKKSILIIDEAQNLSIPLLEEVRLLSNLETDKYKLLQIILVGQPELRTKLARPQLEQLRQRIFLSYHLGALNRKETEGYVKHRIKVAGGGDIFADGAFDEIFEFSGGVPRLINIISTFALLLGFGEEKKVVDLSTVKAARKEVQEDMLQGNGNAQEEPMAEEEFDDEQADIAVRKWKNITANLLRRGML